ncbi:MAG: signal peptide peptidase SppA [Prevotella sp.]
MKDFLKYVGATVTGLILFGLVICILGVMSIVGMVSSSQATQNVSKNSVLVINLSGTLQERTESNIWGELTDKSMKNLGLEEILSAINKAKTNDRIKGIYIESGMMTGDYASRQEIRNALLDFKKSGKKIIAYADNYTQGNYYIASVADKIYLNPQGMIDWHGIGAEPIFVKDLLAKFGIKFQVVKVGKYKSATEMFTSDKMSDPSREQTQAYISGTWNNVCQAVSQSRKISVDQLNRFADNLITFNNPKDYLSEKLIDGLLYTDQVKAEAKKIFGLDADKPINQVDVTGMVKTKENTDGKEIAVYYAYGSIVDSPVEGGLFGSEHMIVATEVCKDLESLANDDDVKAVVIRINSGGGSAYASEQIWHQIEMLKKKKPVVVSMGGMAASGGYYMSCNANWIVAQPTTLTGSIGIFGMIPDRSQLLTQKLGIKFDEVKTNKNSLMGSSARPMNAEEIGFLTQYIDRGYQTFRQRVADGRKMKIEQVEKIAQGHVFLGQDALKIKLVDELGGLDKAVSKAAQLAKLDQYYTDNYPETTDWMEQLLSAATRKNYLDEQMRSSLGEYYEPFILLKTMNQQNMIQARIPYYFNIR